MPIVMIVGSESVIRVPNNHVIIAKFIDELTNILLNCTVQKGDIQADTVWDVAGYPDITKFHIFSDGRQVPSKFDPIHGNHVSISAELMMELDGVIVYCGSHAHPHQAKFEFHVESKLAN